MTSYIDGGSPCSQGGAPSGGNPVWPLSGTKTQSIRMVEWPSFGFDAQYDTRSKLPGAEDRDDLPPRAASFGGLWSSNLHQSLAFQRDAFDTHAAVIAHRSEWLTKTFSKASDGTYRGTTGNMDAVTRDLSGYWRYLDRAANQLELYDGSGRLLSVHFAQGGLLQFQYTAGNTPEAGLLSAVTDTLGRTLRLDYEKPVGAARPRIHRVTSPAGNETRLGYDPGGNLQNVVRGDAPAMTMLYEDARFQWALTGVVGEDGVRRSTYTFDDQGRAQSTEHAGGTNRFGLAYATPPARSVVDTYDATRQVVNREYKLELPTTAAMTLPSGERVDYGFVTVGKAPRLASTSQAAGSGCAASSSRLQYDAGGNVLSRDDFNGNRICYSHNLDRNLESVRVEGLISNASCTLTSAGSGLPSGSRKVSTEWHPNWSLKARVAEPGKITTYVYNGQSDPIAGGTASCAPATAKLPDGAAIAVLCRRIEQATTDTDGYQGFSAQLQAGVAAREHRWTYNQFGQVLTHDGPLPGTADTTSYEYYASTSLTGTDPYAVGYTLGDLRQITNPAGHVTLFTLYDKSGQWLQSLDPNGVVTTRAFDARQRLTMVSVSGEATTYEYGPNGLLRKVTQPDGGFLSHEYDAAQRLVAVSDQLGNRIEYVLDNAGNRTAENVKDAGGGLRRALTRSFDALNRVQQVVGREVAP